MSGSVVKVSQGYEVLRPRADKAFPITCSEWDVLRTQLTELTTEPWLFHSMGTLLIGAAIATVISIWTDAIPAANTTAIITAWAIAIGCAFCGACCVYFAHKERAVHRAKAQMLVTQMRLIEERFER